MRWSHVSTCEMTRVETGWCCGILLYNVLSCVCVCGVVVFLCVVLCVEWYSPVFSSFCVLQLVAVSVAAAVAVVLYAVECCCLVCCLLCCYCCCFTNLLYNRANFCNAIPSRSWLPRKWWGDDIMSYHIISHDMTWQTHRHYAYHQCVLFLACSLPSARVYDRIASSIRFRRSYDSASMNMIHNMSVQATVRWHAIAIATRVFPFHVHTSSCCRVRVRVYSPATAHHMRGSYGRNSVAFRK